jgi:DNA-binding MarR family transcriptional regulator
MSRSIQCRALAEFRYEIRRFLNFSERAARAAGLEPQQHQALLAIKGMPEGRNGTIGFLAERLQTRHHSAVELANRLETRGLLRRLRSKIDRRQVRVELTPRGEKILQRLSAANQSELRTLAPKLLRALRAAITQAGRPSRTRKKRSSSHR